MMGRTLAPPTPQSSLSSPSTHTASMGSTPSSRAVKVGSRADADADALPLGVGIKEPAQQVWRLSCTLAAASSQAAGTSVQSLRGGLVNLKFSAVTQPMRREVGNMSNRHN